MALITSLIILGDARWQQHYEALLEYGAKYGHYNIKERDSVQLPVWSNAMNHNNAHGCNLFDYLTISILGWRHIDAWAMA